MSRNIWITLLFNLGWRLFATLEESLLKISDDKLSWLQSIYSIFHGLTGSTANEIEQSLTIPRYCACGDLTTRDYNYIAKWPTNNVSYSVINTVPSLSIQSMIDATVEAMNRWAKVINLNLIYQPNNRTSMILVGTNQIDGPFGILGQTELPMGQAQCNLTIDSSDNFIMSDNPSQNQIDLVRVICHEAGHGLGMDHIGVGNLMAPMYNIQINKPQQGDIQEMMSRYPGSPVTPVTPATPATPPNPGELVIKVLGGSVSIPGYRLTKLQ